MHLVSYHVLQSLIESGSQKYKDFLFLPSKTTVHSLISISLVSESMKLTGNVVDLLATEGSSIAMGTIEASFL